MAPTGHQGRAHSKLGPSASKRWIECPASVARSEHVENKSSVFALEGTAAHEFLEHILRNGIDPAIFLGGYVNLAGDKAAKKFRFEGDRADDFECDRETTFDIDDEMVEAAEIVVKYVAANYCPDEGDILMLETKLDMSFIHPKLFGTGDIIIYKAKARRIIVLDFKYGSGIAVEVEDNPQVLTYAVGGVRLLRDMGHKVDIVTSVIIQPRCFHPSGPIREQDVDFIDLEFFAGFLKAKAAETDSPDAKFCAGEHCYFCPTAHSCETLKAYVFDATGAGFDGDRPPSEKDMPNPTDMTPKELGRVIREVKIIEGWLRRVMAYAHTEAMDGRVPEGCKVVAKRAYRKWAISQADVETLCEVLSLDRDDFMYPEKLRSPNQIEKATGKKAFGKLFDGMVKKESTGFVLAPEEDRREAVKVDSSDAFGAADDE